MNQVKPSLTFPCHTCQQSIPIKEIKECPVTYRSLCVSCLLADKIAKQPFTTYPDEIIDTTNYKTLIGLDQKEKTIEKKKEFIFIYE